MMIEPPDITPAPARESWHVLPPADFQAGIQRLQREGLVLPYGLAPGSYPGGLNSRFSEDTWATYQWNPPEHMEYTEPDPSAGPKPSWGSIIEASYEGKFESLLPNTMYVLRQECRRRITSAYGAPNESDEIFLRLRGGQTQEQDAERERLRERHRFIKHWLESLPVSERGYKGLEQFDPRDDKYWALDMHPLVY